MCPIIVDSDTIEENKEESKDLASKSNDDSKEKPKRGRPKMSPIRIATKEIIKKIKVSFLSPKKEFEDNDKKARSDIIRFKLLRKAFSIPYVILTVTQRRNTIKELKEEEAFGVYQECFTHFLDV